MMSRRVMGLIAVFAVATVFAGERVPLWPEGKMPDAQPHQIAAMLDEARQPDFKPEEHRMPYVEWFDAPTNGPAKGCVILISGGGYQNCCDVGYIRMWRDRFTGLGFQCVNLVYRTPRPKGLPIYTSAWEDGQRAVRLVRSEATKRGFDAERIGAISMSAGSHLNVLLATSSQTPAYAVVDDLDKVPCHLNFAMTCAIAYGVTDGCGIPNTRDGDAIDAKIAPEFKFDAKTCPMWMSHGGADPFSPFASTLVYRQLRKKGIPAELHLYPDKGHGAYGLERAVEFLTQMGFNGPVASEVRLMGRFPNDDARGGYAKEDVWPEDRTPDLQPKQCKPYIEWHLPKELKTKAIQIVYSGGGYGGNDPEGFEVTPVRRYLNEKGMAVVTMKYRTPRPEGLAKHTTAWQDLQRAIRIVRNEAAERGLDPNRIGIMGSSAGGHLTLMGATSSRHRAYWEIDEIDKLPCNVQWAVAIYPAYALTDGEDCWNTTGGNDDSARLVPEFSFDPATPPVLFIHGDADGWAAMNSVKCWEQLRRMGIQGELHTLARRNHCFQGSAVPGTGSYTWLDRIWEFLSAKGYNR